MCPVIAQNPIHYSDGTTGIPEMKSTEYKNERKNIRTCKQMFTLS